MYAALTKIIPRDLSSFIAGYSVFTAAEESQLEYEMSIVIGFFQDEYVMTGSDGNWIEFLRERGQPNWVRLCAWHDECQHLLKFYQFADDDDTDAYHVYGLKKLVKLHDTAGMDVVVLLNEFLGWRVGKFGHI